MASFVIHNIAAERFLQIASEKYNISFTPEERNEFLMANLIPDSSRLPKINKDATKEERKERQQAVQNEKIATHFRREEDASLCIQLPIVESFVQKYSMSLGTTMSYLGYLFHLYTDKKFFSELFPTSFETLDKNLNPTIYSEETEHMKVTKNGRLYTISEFWDKNSPLSIYNDYTVMNKKLLQYYGYVFDLEKLTEAADTFKNPGIEEVDFNNINKVLNQTAAFIKESYESPNNSLNIFDEKEVTDFIDRTAISFFDAYQGTIPNPKNRTFQKQ